MIKDNSYYNKHKVVYNDELQKLDTTIISQIFDDPQSDESILLNERVKRIIQEEVDN